MKSREVWLDGAVLRGEATIPSKSVRANSMRRDEITIYRGTTRKRNGLALAQIAEQYGKSGVTVARVSQIEHAENLPEAVAAAYREAVLAALAVEMQEDRICLELSKSFRNPKKP